MANIYFYKHEEEKRKTNLKILKSEIFLSMNVKII